LSIDMTKKEFRYLFNILALFIVVVAYFGFRLLPRHTADPVKSDSFVYVTRAIDGDTIKLSTGEHVRFIGIDCPESRYNAKLERDIARSRKDMNVILNMGKEASKFTRHLVEGKRVRLEFDVRKYDKYGRLLAYVYLEDGTFVNAKIMEEGYAQVMTIPPNVKYADTFLKLQREARDKHKGLWNEVDTSSLF
jgi:micrococcal nuclease